ncbi:hypothetical protein M885DRAFT_543379 [Pelagophyceae sp. CCMP2097]|nr:hypothetical protein M885DRAFT_543379 [Pelagophyceae sp. CCMP2097]
MVVRFVALLSVLASTLAAPANALRPVSDGVGLRGRGAAAARGAFDRYDRSLVASPVATKMVTSALVECLGDALARCLEARARRKAGVKRKAFDWRRTCAIAADGLLTGVVLHFVYGLQDAAFPPRATWWVPLAHIVVDECFVDPVLLFFFISVTDCDWKRFWPTMRASKAVTLATLPIQYANFRYAPLRYRVLVVSAIDFVWTCAVSRVAHNKPPEKQN